MPNRPALVIICFNQDESNRSHQNKYGATERETKKKLFASETNKKKSRAKRKQNIWVTRFHPSEDYNNTIYNVIEQCGSCLHVAKSLDEDPLGLFFHKLRGTSRHTKTKQQQIHRTALVVNVFLNMKYPVALTIVGHVRGQVSGVVNGTRTQTYPWWFYEGLNS